MRRNIPIVALLALAATGSVAGAITSRPTRPRAIAIGPSASHAKPEPRSLASTPHRAHAAAPSAHAAVKGHQKGSARESAHATPAAAHQAKGHPAAAPARGAAHPAAAHAARLAHTAAPAAVDRATIDRVHAWVRDRPGEGASGRTEGRVLPAQPDTSPDVPEIRLSGTSHPPDDDASPAGTSIVADPVPGSAVPIESSATVTTTVPLARALPASASKALADEVAIPVYLPSLYDKRGHLVVPAALKGSHDILLHQNLMADRDGLDRVQDDADLASLRHDKKLVPIPVSDALRVDERLPENRRYARPWAAGFLAAMARDHYTRFHTAIQVNSAVRTVEFQQKLLLTNGNAAPADGDTASPHLTGQAIDIAKRGLPLVEIAWMRAYLQPLIAAGKIDVEEEFQQSCFHISIYKSFLPPHPAPKVTVAAAHHPALTAAVE